MEAVWENRWLLVPSIRLREFPSETANEVFRFLGLRPVVLESALFLLLTLRYNPDLEIG